MLVEVLMKETDLPSDRIKDLRGRKIGEKGYVMAFSHLSEDKQANWLCLCGDCGNEFITSSYNLNSIKIISCRNCSRKRGQKKNIENRQLDLVETIFGNGCQVIKLFNHTKHGLSWKCLCGECNEEFVAYTYAINKQLVNSCPKCGQKHGGCKRRSDLVGFIFGKNCKVIRYLKSERTKVHWECTCGVCGNEFVTTTNRIIGRTKPQQTCKDCRIKDVVGDEFGNGCVVLGNAPNKPGRRMLLVKCHCGVEWEMGYSGIRTVKECRKCAFKTAATLTSGKNHYHYNHDLTYQERCLKRRIARRWKYHIYRRDNHQCQLTGKTKKETVLNAHHLDGWHWAKDLRFRLDNGITLCKEVHDKFHQEYTKTNNTREQFLKFVTKYYPNKLESVLHQISLSNEIVK